MRLTYEDSRLSATLADVFLDVGKSLGERFSTWIHDFAVLSTRAGDRKLKVSNMVRMRLIRVFN